MPPLVPIRRLSRGNSYSHHFVALYFMLRAATYKHYFFATGRLGWRKIGFQVNCGNCHATPQEDRRALSADRQGREVAIGIRTLIRMLATERLKYVPRVKKSIAFEGKELLRLVHTLRKRLVDVNSALQASQKHRIFRGVNPKLAFAS